MSDSFVFPEWQKEKWTDYSENPLIDSGTADREMSVIADPQIILPENFDGQWHAFCHGCYKNGGGGYYHFVSEDGLRWSFRKKLNIHTGPAFIFHDEGNFYLYTTEVLNDEEREKYRANTVIAVRTGTDLEDWSKPRYVLFPDLSWEREMTQGICELIQARNPCMVKLANGKYRLYYSAGTVYLDKCGFEEPKYISFAEADSPSGPFLKHCEPIISPDENLWYRNLGAGAIKVFGYENKFLALYNSVYTDKNGYQHSAINLLLSDDGIAFEEAPFNPVFLPSGNNDCKNAFIYQLDMVRFKDEIRVYYNTRDGWKDAGEQICMSYIKDKIPVRKLWDI